MTRHVNAITGQPFMAMPDLDAFASAACYQPIAELRETYRRLDARRREIRAELDGLEGRGRQARRLDVDAAADALLAGKPGKYDKIGPQVDEVKRRRETLRAEFEVVAAAIVRVANSLDDLLAAHGAGWADEIDAGHAADVAARREALAAYRAAHERIAKRQGLSQWLRSAGTVNKELALAAPTILPNGAQGQHFRIGQVLDALEQFESYQPKPTHTGLDGEGKLWAARLRREVAARGAA